MMEPRTWDQWTREPVGTTEVCDGGTVRRPWVAKIKISPERVRSRRFATETEAQVWLDQQQT